MTELLPGLAHGAAIALHPANVVYCLLGALLGTLVGVLPGLGVPATIAMLLPITFSLPPAGALIMLAGIYYGAQYGGSTTAILVNIPGESSSVVTALDGHQMARRGRAGPALAIAALGSFAAGTVATLVVASAAPPLTAFAQRFGPAEYFALMTLGLVAAVLLASGSALKAVLMILAGILLGLVGTDIETGQTRFTFGIAELADGIGFVPLSMGLFGVADVIANLEEGRRRDVVSGAVRGRWPSAEDLRASGPAIARGTALGCVLGVLPGGGAILSSFASYSLEKRLARDPTRFGRGAIEGVAGPESANNAGAQASFIPMLTLGIPSNPVMALMMGAMIIHGIQPGPQVISKRPDLFWGVVVSMWLGNLMLLVINLPLVGIWARLLRVPYRMLFPAILLFCCIGAYSLNSSALEVGLMALFGLVGYAFVKLACEPAPLLLGFVLGPMLEENLRRALLISRGDPTVFVTRPLSLALLLAALGLVLLILAPAVRRRREGIFTG